MEQWLEGIREMVGVGSRVLLGNSNAHYRAWSLDGRSGPSGRVLRRWIEERGARLVKGEGNTFERTCECERVASRIDFALEGDGARLGPLETVWGLSDYLAIGGWCKLMLWRVWLTCGRLSTGMRWHSRSLMRTRGGIGTSFVTRHMSG